MSETGFVARRVLWKDVRDHMVKRLMIDAEWMVESDHALTWWPSFLPQELAVTAAGEFNADPDDNWIRVTASTVIAEVGEDLGLELVDEYASWFPMGALIWQDGRIRLTTSLALNPLCRDLLTWFHEAALAQATVAVELAEAWADLDGAHIVERAHPVRGVRDEPDELLHIYFGDRYRLEEYPELRSRYEAARPILRDLFLSFGYSQGFSNDDVDFFTLEEENGFDLAIGFMPEAPPTGKFGLGLFIMARIMPYGHAYDTYLTNDANAIVADDLLDVSQFGRITGGEEAAETGSVLEAYIPHGVLAEYRGNPREQLVPLVHNAAAHCAGAARRFRYKVMGLRTAAQDER